MEHRDTEGFLNELAVRVFSGDWRGYRDMVEDGMITVGDKRTVLQLGDDLHRRALSQISVRIAATGWDGMTVRVVKSTAYGRDLELVETLSTPTTNGVAAAVPFAEGYLLRHGLAGPRVIALLNPTSERFWQSGDARHGPLRPRAGAAEAVIRTVTAMLAALRGNNLGAFLKWVDLPTICVLTEDVIRCVDASGVRDLVRRLQPASAAIASLDVELVEMARFGDALVAARFAVQLTLQGGQRLDPYHNLYFLRQGPDGWRVVLAASPALDRLPPSEGASASQYAASAHGMNLKDN